MKPITLHPISVLAGLVLAGLTFLATGAAQIPRPTRTVFVGEVPAEWWTYVDLPNPQSSFTVPTGRHLVVTAVAGGSSLVVDGQSAAALVQFLEAGFSTSPNGTRVPFAPGTV